MGLGLPLLFGLIHSAVLARLYHVGSFDDDASYVLAGKALASGHALTGQMIGGHYIVAAYPPGYPLLLAPFLVFFPNSYEPLRLLSAACFVALFPMVWYYLTRRAVSYTTKVGVMVLLGLSPDLASYSTMIMAEMPFLVVLMTIVILVDFWQESSREIGPLGIAVAILSGYLVLLKEAGLGLVIGLIVWLLFKRQMKRAITVLVGLVALIVPVIIARMIIGIPFAGSRYTQEIGGFYHGGLLGRLFSTLPGQVVQYLDNAIPSEVLFIHPHSTVSGDPLAWILAIQVSVFAVVGMIIWFYRHRDATTIMVLAYVGETSLYPDINNRRALLIAPILLAWYVLGVVETVRFLRQFLIRPGRHARVRRHLVGVSRFAVAGVALVMLVVAILPPATQFTYISTIDTTRPTSQFGGSRYMALAKVIGNKSWVVETDYLYGVALWAGDKLTRRVMFAETQGPGGCNEVTAQRGIRADHANLLLIADVKWPGVSDRPCLESIALRSTWAVRLLRTSLDQASLFELIGPGSGDPDLVDHVAGALELTSGPLTRVHIAANAQGDQSGLALATTAVNGTADLEWNWTTVQPVSQVSVGEAGAVHGSARGVSVQLLEPTGNVWKTVASSRTQVGDAPGASPFLLAKLPTGTRARAVRLLIHGKGLMTALDVHALGPSS